MPFGLNNMGTTYQRMMSKNFRDETWETLEVYMDGMIVKSSQNESHDIHV